MTPGVTVSFESARPGKSPWRNWSLPIYTLVVVAIIVAVVPRLRDLLLRQEGYSLVIDDAVKRTAVGKPGDVAHVTFRFRNLSEKEIHVQGVESNCACVTVDDVPFSVSPKSERYVTVSVEANPRDAGKEVVRSSRLFVDVNSPPIVLEVRLRVGELVD